MLCLWLVIAVPVRAAQLQAVTAQAIIAAVNALRASQGLAPYTIDGGLMSYAQEHANYMALTNQGTHRHSDGTMPSEHGISENVASGSKDSLNASFIVYTIWADALHMRTMTGHSSGSIGVGVASNDSQTYVSLDVRPSGASVGPPGSGSPGVGGGTPVVLIAPVVTATPLANGSIVHVVAYGQSLWQIAIAYGVRINDIRGLNGLPADSTTIYEGQKLVIFPAGSVTTATPTAPVAVPPTASVEGPTAIPTLGPTLTRPTPTATPAAAIVQATPTSIAAPATAEPALSGMRSWLALNGRSLLIGFLLTSAGALFIVFLYSFRK